MADDRYTLAEARAIINAEQCVRYEDNTWCTTHSRHWRLHESRCSARPEVADVAAQLLAERGSVFDVTAHLTDDERCKLIIMLGGRP